MELVWTTSEHPAIAWRGDESREVVIVHGMSLTEKFPKYSIAVTLDGHTVSATGRDAFAAVADVRSELAPLGWVLAVEGARLASYPSGMQRDQGAGRVVYRMTMGQNARPEDTRSIFDPIDRSEVATVEAQKAFFMEWVGL